MAETEGVSRPTMSREAVEASEAALERLLERRFEDEGTKENKEGLAKFGTLPAG